MSDIPVPQNTTRRLGKTELTAMIAFMFAIIALSIDAMLPALPNIAAELSPDDANKAQLVLTVFLFGMGIGLFFAGPISDAIGRRPVIIAGALLYAGASFMAVMSSTLEVLLFSRFIMGICAAGPRIVSLAAVRDLYKGREMAQLMSYAIMIFTLVPAVAPALGAAILTVSGWRTIFAVFIVFALVVAIWVSLRLPETHAAEHRRPLRISSLLAATKELFTHPVARTSILIQALAMGMLFSMLTSIQQIYGEIFDRAATFPYWFALVALVSGLGSILNAKLVPRFGMRAIVVFGLWGQCAFSFVMLALSLSLPSDQIPFAFFVIWQCSIFLMIAAAMGNLNAMAMEPVGHIAGLAASVIAAISTVLGVLFATPVGQMFDGTLRPMATGVFMMACIAALIMRSLTQRETQATAAE
ncbi:multidrug effflux MFS transporter [Epibacterium ulvae]|uniref:multidrug effflux MFS transporter n=1 Tax=Epibacterium ulvae TaxID=1156985 RepID=UPI001BFC6CBF|nr:multidrug effflux MFS transporter [Epibacterium ulvae]MBT8154404.1 multidrug effflux MFS transporter [Epibacterium ulvae]